jgi:hypothetical protein
MEPAESSNEANITNENKLEDADIYNYRKYLMIGSIVIITGII